MGTASLTLWRWYREEVCWEWWCNTCPKIDFAISLINEGAWCLIQCMGTCWRWMPMGTSWFVSTALTSRGGECLQTWASPVIWPSDFLHRGTALGYVHPSLARLACSPHLCPAVLTFESCTQTSSSNGTTRNASISSIPSSICQVSNPLSDSDLFVCLYSVHGIMG